VLSPWVVLPSSGVRKAAASVTILPHKRRNGNNAPTLRLIRHTPLPGTRMGEDKTHLREYRSDAMTLPFLRRRTARRT